MSRSIKIKNQFGTLKVHKPVLKKEQKCFKVTVTIKDQSGGYFTGFGLMNLTTIELKKLHRFIGDLIEQ